MVVGGSTRQNQEHVYFTLSLSTVLLKSYDIIFKLAYFITRNSNMNII
jgi:hypothetical protein